MVTESGAVEFCLQRRRGKLIDDAFGLLEILFELLAAKLFVACDLFGPALAALFHESVVALVLGFKERLRLLLRELGVFSQGLQVFKSFGVEVRVLRDLKVVLFRYDRFRVGGFGFNGFLGRSGVRGLIRRCGCLIGRSGRRCGCVGGLS